MTFRGDADGDEAPIRIIQGPLTGLRQFDKLTVDPVNDEVLVYFRNQVVVFDRTANGDVAPKRALSLQEGLRISGAAVDPLRDLLVVAGGDRISIFDRTAEGDAEPRAVIGGGPVSGLRVGSGMALYPPTGKILVIARGATGERVANATSASPEALASDTSYVGVWSIDDRGDVPPQWTIAGPKGMLRQGRGVTLDPENKTVIISDKYLNGVLTYSFPELFEEQRVLDTARAD